MNTDEIKNLYTGMSDNDLVVITAGDLRLLVEAIESLKLQNDLPLLNSEITSELEVILEPREELLTELEQLLTVEGIKGKDFLQTQIEIYTNVGALTESQVVRNEDSTYSILCKRIDPHDPIVFMIESDQLDDNRELWAAATRIERIISQLISISKSR